MEILDKAGNSIATVSINRAKQLRLVVENATPELMKKVEELIAREPYEAPKFTLDPSVTDFYAFTPDSVRLEGYRAHPLEGKIPVAV